MQQRLLSPLIIIIIIIIELKVIAVSAALCLYISFSNFLIRFFSAVGRLKSSLPKSILFGLNVSHGIVHTSSEGVDKLM